MSFINAVIIASTIICIVIAFTILLCLCDCCMSSSQQSHIILTYDIFMNQVYVVGDYIFNIVFCCCRTINRTVIPREDPIPIREIELTEMVIVSNPLGAIELGSPSKTE